MSESWVEKAVERMYQKLNPKGGPSRRYFRRFIRKNKIKKLFNHGELGNHLLQRKEWPLDTLEIFGGK